MSTVELALATPISSQKFLTASGVYPTANYTCACGDQISFGTEIYIEGLGIYICEDRGVSNGCVDIYVNDHSEIPSWGLAYFDTYKLEE